MVPWQPKTGGWYARQRLCKAVVGRSFTISRNISGNQQCIGPMPPVANQFDDCGQGFVGVYIEQTSPGSAHEVGVRDLN